MRSKIVSWFSAGVSSAVATKLYIDRISEIYYIHIEDQHPDSLRFVKDCEAWFDKPITILQSPHKSVEGVCISQRYINGPSGAACTRLLKKSVRLRWEYEQPLGTRLTYVWGMDYEEKSRAGRIIETMSNQDHIFPLIDLKMTKESAHQMLKANGIERPEMYRMGYTNNNCIGCVKGGMGYWNKIRVDFPEVFTQRAAMERLVGATCVKGIYLDELAPNRGRTENEVMDDCGILCEALYKVD